MKYDDTGHKTEAGKEKNMTDLDQRIKEAFEAHKAKGDIEDMASLYDFKAGYLAALPRWIPVEDPPKKDGWYLAGRKNEESSRRLYWKSSAKKFVDLPSGYTVSVTHWMPLPQPPEVD